MTDHAEYTKDEYLRRICGEGAHDTPPKEIFLQMEYHDDGPNGPPPDYDGVTWCSDRIHDTDVRYILAVDQKEDLEEDGEPPESQPDDAGG